MIRNTLFKIAIISMAMLLACTENTSMKNVDLDESAFLMNMGSNIIVPAYQDLSNKSFDLKESIEAFSQSPTLDKLEDVKVKLKSARLTWQSCNMFAFGPAEDLSLTSQTNIFPIDKNQIQKNIESGNYDLGTVSNNDTKGFPAIAYLIYGENQSAEEILTEFTIGTFAANRLQYLQDVVTIIDDNAKTVLASWQDSYLAKFQSETSFGTNAGSSASQLFNDMIQVYERQLRDGKIGIPVGVRSLGEIIPTSTEAYHGGYSTELAKENLKQFKSLFNGGNSYGFDDYLIAYDREDLVLEINQKFEQLISSFQSIPDPLSSQLETNKSAIEGVFIDMQDLVNLLKTDVASQLSIDITFVDMDGD